jgi:hypothetical protein
VSITVGLLRDGQYEMALERLEDLHQTGVPIPPWLYDIFIFTFGKIGAHEETLMILQYRLMNPEVTVQNNVWSSLLDVFGRDSFYDGVKYVWDRAVSSGILNPSDGVILNVLNTASRNGDTTMAMDAIRILSTRGRKLGLHHFEPLLEVHAAENNLQRALQTICLMNKAGLQPDLSSTRPIYQKLRVSSSQTDEAVEMLRDLQQHHPVPTAAFNVVLEATLLHHGFKPGLDLYRSIPQFCNGKPDAETYNLLLGRCTLHKSMRFLLAEMEVFSVKPDDTTYNRAILISTLNPNYEPAFRYLEKMSSSETEGKPDGWWMNRATALALIRRCILAEDNRAQDLFAECRRRGLVGIEADVRTLLSEAQNKRELGLAARTDPGVKSALVEPSVAQQVLESMSG